MTGLKNELKKKLRDIHLHGFHKNVKLGIVGIARDTAKLRDNVS